jgi:hypothetical protein
MEGLLGSVLFTGIGLSQKRRQELQNPLTNAVRLYIGENSCADFTLEVWLHPCIADCIFEASKLSLEALRCLLGDTVFKAMIASKYRKGEETIGKLLTSAIEVLPVQGGDRRLLVTVDCMMGFTIWDVMCPYIMDAQV